MENHLSKEDALTLDNFALRGSLLDMRCEKINAECAQFRAERDAHAQAIRLQYDLAEGDRVDTATGVITRAPRPEPKTDDKAEFKGEVVKVKKEKKV